MRVLYAASEVYPFAKTGGLSDVAYGLPRALSAHFDMTVVMPLYRRIDREAFGIEKRGKGFDIVLGGETFAVSLYGCTYGNLSFVFIYIPILCDREYLYGPPDAGYEDNALRFGLFSYAVVRLAERMQSDVVHLNDWQTALAALLIADAKPPKPKTVYTIHNLAYQGVFGKEAREQLAIDRRHFTMEGVEFYGGVNLMKAGIGYADAVTTVSPNYADEILGAQFGCGLEGYLNRHRAKLAGIVNGIDTEHFSPSTDAALARPYKTARGKGSNKRAYLASVGLEGEEKPLFIFIGRFTWQKGMEMLISALPQMAARACNIAILGEGESHYREAIACAARPHRNVHLFFGYDEALAHRMYAAADFLLMPSLFEPCGLNQLIAMHYGAVPVVHRVGGLADTVRPAEMCGEAEGCGIVFDEATPDALLEAFDAALLLYGDAVRYRRIAAENMAADVSWKQRAGHYAALYRKLSRGALK